MVSESNETVTDVVVKKENILRSNEKTDNYVVLSDSEEEEETLEKSVAATPLLTDLLKDTKCANSSELDCKNFVNNGVIIKKDLGSDVYTSLPLLKIKKEETKPIVPDIPVRGDPLQKLEKLVAKKDTPITPPSAIALGLALPAVPATVAPIPVSIPAVRPGVEQHFASPPAAVSPRASYLPPRLPPPPLIGVVRSNPRPTMNTAFACPICDTVLTDQRAMQLHLQQHDFGQAPLECITCKMQFSNRAFLHQHIIATNHGVLCNICSMPFPTSAECETHKQSHTRTMTQTAPNGQIVRTQRMVVHSQRPAMVAQATGIRSSVSARPTGPVIVNPAMARPGGGAPQMGRPSQLVNALARPRQQVVMSRSISNQSPLQQQLQNPVRVRMGGQQVNPQRSMAMTGMQRPQMMNRSQPMQQQMGRMGGMNTNMAQRTTQMQSPGTAMRLARILNSNEISLTPVKSSQQVSNSSILPPGVRVPVGTQLIAKPMQPTVQRRSMPQSRTAPMQQGSQQYTGNQQVVAAVRNAWRPPAPGGQANRTMVAQMGRVQPMPRPPVRSPMTNQVYNQQPPNWRQTPPQYSAQARTVIAPNAAATRLQQLASNHATAPYYQSGQTASTVIQSQRSSIPPYPASTAPSADGIDQTVRFACPVCGRRFLYETVLQKHMQNSHGHDPKQPIQPMLISNVSHAPTVSCPKCPANFASQEQLASHWLVAHPGEQIPSVTRNEYGENSEAVQNITLASVLGPNLITVSNDSPDARGLPSNSIDPVKISLFSDVVSNSESTGLRIQSVLSLGSPAQEGGEVKCLISESPDPFFPQSDEEYDSDEDPVERKQRRQTLKNVVFLVRDAVARHVISGMGLQECYDKEEIFEEISEPESVEENYEESEEVHEESPSELEKISEEQSGEIRAPDEFGDFLDGDGDGDLGAPDDPDLDDELLQSDSENITESVSQEAAEENVEKPNAEVESAEELATPETKEDNDSDRSEDSGEPDQPLREVEEKQASEESGDSSSNTDGFQRKFGGEVRSRIKVTARKSTKTQPLTWTQELARDRKRKIEDSEEDYDDDESPTAARGKPGMEWLKRRPVKRSSDEEEGEEERAEEEEEEEKAAEQPRKFQMEWLKQRGEKTGSDGDKVEMDWLKRGEKSESPMNSPPRKTEAVTPPSSAGKMSMDWLKSRETKSEMTPPKTEMVSPRQEKMGLDWLKQREEKPKPVSDDEDEDLEDEGPPKKIVQSEAKSEPVQKTDEVKLAKSGMEWLKRKPEPAREKVELDWLKRGDSARDDSEDSRSASPEEEPGEVGSIEAKNDEGTDMDWLKKREAKGGSEKGDTGEEEMSAESTESGPETEPYRPNEEEEEKEESCKASSSKVGMDWLFKNREGRGSSTHEVPPLKQDKMDLDWLRKQREPKQTVNSTSKEETKHSSTVGMLDWLKKREVTTDDEATKKETEVPTGKEEKENEDSQDTDETAPWEDEPDLDQDLDNDLEGTADPPEEAPMNFEYEGSDEEYGNSQQPTQQQEHPTMRDIFRNRGREYRESPPDDEFDEEEYRYYDENREKDEQQYDESSDSGKSENGQQKSESGKRKRVRFMLPGHEDEEHSTKRIMLSPHLTVTQPKSAREVVLKTGPKAVNPRGLESARVKEKPKLPNKKKKKEMSAKMLTNASNGMVCEICDLEFTSQRSFVHHVQMHWGQDIFPCVRCAKDFEGKKRFIRHLRSHMRSLSGKQRLPFWAYQHVLVAVLRAKFGSGQRLSHKLCQQWRICDECGMRFRNTYEWDIHRKRCISISTWQNERLQEEQCRDALRKRKVEMKRVPAGAKATPPISRPRMPLQINRINFTPPHPRFPTPMHTPPNLNRQLNFPNRSVMPVQSGSPQIPPARLLRPQRRLVVPIFDMDIVDRNARQTGSLETLRDFGMVGFIPIQELEQLYGQPQQPNARIQNRIRFFRNNM